MKHRTNEFFSGACRLSSRCYGHRRLLVRVSVFSANKISNIRAISQGSERGAFIAAGQVGSIVYRGGHNN